MFLHRIMFVCHGNICRSTMAECILKHMVAQRGISHQFDIASSATSTEEIGNPIHRGTRQVLAKAGIPVCAHRAVQLRPSDYHRYDLILGMDGTNIHNILHIVGGNPNKKVRRLLDFDSSQRDIADPWYTGDFDLTYTDITAGCEALLSHLLR